MLRMELSVLPFHSLGSGDGFTCAGGQEGMLEEKHLQKDTLSPIVEITFFCEGNESEVIDVRYSVVISEQCCYWPQSAERHQDGNKEFKRKVLGPITWTNC